MVTRVVEFDRADLPKWARRHKAVVELCRANLSYCCDVCAAQTMQMRRILIAMAIREQA